MKMTTILLTLFCVGTAMTLAEESTAEKARSEQMFRNFDTDGDGSVSLEEYRAGMAGNMSPERVAKVFGEKDRNHDGKLNSEELAYVPLDQRPSSNPPQKAATPKAAEMSKVPRAPEAPKAVEIPKPAEAPQPATAGKDRAERLFRAFDMNHDGFVSLDEYRQGMIGNMVESRVEKVFKEKDRNGDGKLTLDELLYVPTDQKEPAPTAAPVEGKRGSSKSGSAGR